MASNKISFFIPTIHPVGVSGTINFETFINNINRVLEKSRSGASLANYRICKKVTLKAQEFGASSLHVVAINTMIRITYIFDLPENLAEFIHYIKQYNLDNYIPEL